MKNPECYLGNDAEFEFFSFHEIVDIIAEAQKDAYNQGVENAINAEWRQHNGIEFTDEEMRIKLKIK